HIDDATLLVNREEAPDVDAGAVLPTLAGPSVVALLAFLRHRVEGPDELSRAHVPRAYIAGGTARRNFLSGAARDHQVLVDEGRRGEPVAAGQTAHDGIRVQVDDAVVAELRVRLARPRVDRIELPVAGSEHDLRRCLAVSAPVFHAARGGIA